MSIKEKKSIHVNPVSTHLDNVTIILKYIIVLSRKHVHVLNSRENIIIDPHSEI